MKSSLVHKVTCVSWSSNYNGETCRHFKTRIEEDIKKDNKSHMFKLLHSAATCFDWYNPMCFKIIDKANSKFDLRIKEALHINWRKSNLNAQQSHLALTLSLGLWFPLLLSAFVCFSFVIFLQFSFIYCSCYLCAIIDTFYCLNYSLLLLYLFIAPSNRFYTNYVINICSRQLLWLI